ncbi:hypothetical protein R1sor_003126 [Riccia sorocarpa]|uniref:Mediator of RNA polymerase II transcription subunit 19a n=1 Tax=Riccia sorocarpa TaxID=122646 RepID=A0ABD3H4L1_9MARC
MAGRDLGTSVFRLLSAVGPRQRELTGAIDLVQHYGLSDLYNYFCKSTLPVAIADTQYLQQVVGDTEIRKGEGMELGQLVDPSAEQHFTQSVTVQPLDLQLLQWAFTLQENKPIQLPEADRGLPTISGNVKEDKDRKHKKKHKKHKHRHKDKDKKEKDKDASKGENGEDRSKKHKKKKRKHEGGEDDAEGHKHKKKKDKHKHSKVDASGATKNGK